MRPLSILVTGEPVTPVLEARGRFERLIEQRARAFRGGFRAVDVREERLPALGQVAGVIVTGSAASVTERLPWMLETAEFLVQAVRERVPVLGICFGHQLLAEALGGRVARNPRGREMGTVTAEVLAPDPLLSEARPFTVNTTHVDTVMELPAGTAVLARTELEPNAALRFGELAWGVQFHPEFDAEVMRGYLAARSELVRAEGGDPEALRASAHDAPPGAEVLERFAALVTELER